MHEGVRSGLVGRTSTRSGLLQVEVAILCAAIRDWSVAQIACGSADLDQLICDDKALRGSIEPTAGGGSAFIAYVTLFAASLARCFNQIVVDTRARSLQDETGRNGLKFDHWQCGDVYQRA